MKELILFALKKSAQKLICAPLSTLQSFTLALITVLIPFAIALFEITEFTALDLKVLVKKVVNFKELPCLCILIFIPLVFWDPVQNSEYLQSWLFLIYICGVGALVWSIIKAHRWILDQQHRNKFRHQYLQELDLRDLKNKNAVGIYSSLWKSNILPDQEINFLQDFFTLINKALKHKIELYDKRIESFWHKVIGKIFNKKPFSSTIIIIDTVSVLLADFSENIEKRSLSTLLDKHFLKCFFIQYKSVAQREQEIEDKIRQNGESKEQEAIDNCKKQFQRLFKQLIHCILQNSLQSKTPTPSYLLTFLGRTFCNSHCKISHSDIKLYYGELARIFWKVLFAQIEKNPTPNWSDILKVLPKIESSRVRSNIFYQFALLNFLEWFKKRAIGEDTKDTTFQAALQIILSELFQANAGYLTKLLTFAFSAGTSKLPILIFHEQDTGKRECFNLIKMLLTEKSLIQELSNYKRYFTQEKLSKHIKLLAQEDNEDNKEKIIYLCLLKELYNELYGELKS